MITVHTSVPFDPDRSDEGIELVRELAERSREEDGVVRYRAMVDLEDDHLVRFFEQYENEAALRAHTETDHYQRFVDRLPELVDEVIETITIPEGGTPRVDHFTAEDAAEES